MKYINKEIQNEPKSLRNYRNNTPNASYNGYSDKIFENGKIKKPLREALLKEQGYLCAYCMKRINLKLNNVGKPNIEVEHFKSQELNAHLDLSYGNMIGVCNGLSLTYPQMEEMHHCDKTKGKNGKMNGQVKLRKLNPCSKNCEKLITYQPDGTIVSVSDDKDVLFDIKQILNLNNRALKNARRIVIEKARQKLIEERASKDWSKSFLRKHLKKWQSKNERGEFREYCMVAIKFLEKLIARPKYK